jgi:hypothetical protein
MMHALGLSNFELECIRDFNRSPSVRTHVEVANDVLL